MCGGRDEGAKQMSVVRKRSMGINKGSIGLACNVEGREQLSEELAM